VSGLPTVFSVVLGVTLAVVLKYIYDGNGYGVFKLAAWAHPFAVVGFSAGVLGAARWLQVHRGHGFVWIPYAALALYVVPNLGMVTQIGINAARHTAESRINLAPLLSFQEVRELGDVGARWGTQGIVVALPDVVTGYWVKLTMRTANPSPAYLPWLTLDVQDSELRQQYPALGRYLLHGNTPVTDIVPPAACPAVWSNRLFALSVLDECRNVLAFGEGWYGFEQSNTTPWLNRFRWLRKRGELLLINPDTAPQRLRISLITGPGNPSPRRTISVFLNGKEIDSFALVGTARVLTKPFVATGPVAQLQIEVKEDASSLPRRWALWNRWVPEDARRLNIAITRVALAGINAECDLPTSLNLLSEGETQPLTNGFFADRWMGAEAAVTLTSPAPPDAIALKGMIPAGMNLPSPFHLDLTLNGAPLPSCTIARPGPFQVSCPIPAEVRRSLKPSAPVYFGIKAEATFTTSADPRQLSLQLERVDLTKAQSTNQNTLGQ